MLNEKEERGPPLSDTNRHSREGFSWYVTERWQNLDGEFRSNYCRGLSIGAFYLIHLLHYARPMGMFELDEQPSIVFHRCVTLIAAIWILMSVGIDLCLRNRVFPRWLPYAATTVDVILVTAVLGLGGGQQSPLVLGYLLVVILASLRANLRLIRFATVAALLGYLLVMAMAKWPERFGIPPIGRVPRYAQIMTLTAIAVSGIMLGQLIRRFRHMANHFASQLAKQVADEEAKP